MNALDLVISPAAAAALHGIHRDRLPMFAIYRPTTQDYPGEWVARLHFSLPSPAATNLLLRAPTLDEIRAVMPPAAVRLDRQPGDDETIEETWI